MRCPDCHQRLPEDEDKCECGWKPSRLAVDTAHPPQAEDVLTQIAAGWLNTERAKHADARIPRNARELASWWIKIQERPDEKFDRPTQHTRRDGKGKYWKTPYIDRLTHTLRKFLCQENHMQGLIIASAEDGIHWRGESESEFLTVIAETERMRKIGPAAYRKECVTKAASLVNKLSNQQRGYGT